MQVPSNFKGVFYAILSSATFGLIPLLALPVVEAGIEKPSVLFYRFALSAMVMGCLGLFKRRNFKVAKSHIPFLALFGFFYAATALLLMDAYLLIPSGIATTIHFLYPVMVALIMILFFKEKSSKSLFIAILLSLIGVAVLSWNSEGFLNIGGILIAVGSIFTYAFYIIGMHKSCVRIIDEYILTFYVLLFSALFFLVNVIFTTDFQPIPDFKSGISICLLAFFPTVVSDLALILAIKHIGSTTTSILGSMEPLTAVTVGVLVFNEPFGVRTVTGVICILIAVATIIMTQRESS